MFKRTGARKQLHVGRVDGGFWPGLARVWRKWKQALGRVIILFDQNLRRVTHRYVDYDQRARGCRSLRGDLPEPGGAGARDLGQATAQLKVCGLHYCHVRQTE